ncbi:substrate-binding and VWA domain-containing protein [Cryptosporangium aurantiacum]|uniref:Ca-activated chloride channel family protein n=1 Tax=Cryptosporangium aurantiacum TaxID=134849 RepID=A0A1M7RMD1_9ACTN|nr:substrate-binding and VWA domain-containing protein [Cryptosporangium aurantiacum]SHN47473.1 Ca-activated chloride channel family protein [Cryptosporangium aurantiacum]
MATGRHRRLQASRRKELEAEAAAQAPRRRTGPVAPWMVAAVVAVLVFSGVTAGYVVAARAGCDGTPTTLSVVTSPDQVDVVSKLASSWEDGKPSVDGRCARIQVTGEASRDVAAALSPDWEKTDDEVTRPDVWMPDSSSWILSAARRENAAPLVSGDRASVATSPVVMAVPRPMAEALGWPSKQISWSDFVGLHFRNQTWKNFGHPEWGDIKLGMSEPTTSTAGLLSLVPISDRNGDNKISLDEAKALLVFSRSVTDRQPDSSGWYTKLKNTANEDAAIRTISAFPSLEHDIATYNASTPRVKLVPVYPGEGTVFADYPYLPLNASWVDSFRQKVANGFLEYLQTGEAQQAYGDAGFRTPDRSTRYAANTLGELGFSDQIGAVAREVGSAATVDRTVVYWTALERTTTFLAVVDTSGSMVEKLGDKTRMQVVQEAAIKAISLFDDDSRVGLWQFSTNLVGSQDWRQVMPLTRAGSTDKATGRPFRELGIEKVLALQPGGNTGLYDTVLAAYQYMQKNWQPRQLNLVVVLTDGRNQDDNGISRSELLNRLRDTAQPDRPVQVITLGLGDSVDEKELSEISSATGGKSYKAKDADDLERLWLATILGESPPN